MAFSGVAARGSAVDTVSDNSLAMNPTAALAVGKLVVVQCVTTNEQTTDGASSSHSLASSPTNSWTKIDEYTETAGANNDGTTNSLWYSVITTEIGTGGTITLTTSANEAEKIICAIEATFDNANNIIAFETVGVGQNAISASVSSLPSREYLLVGAGGARGSDNAKTPDTDYTEWHDLRNRNNAAAVTNHLVTRIATLTSDTCTSSAWTNTFPIFLLAPLYETPDPNITIEPGVGSVGFTGQTPSLSLGATASPTAGAVAFAGEAPTASAGITANADVGTVLFTGYAPAVSAGGGLTERLTPNAVLAGGSNLRDTLSNSPPTRLEDIQDDTGGSPGPDANWWTAVNPEADIDVRLGFPTSSGNLVGTQTINAYIRGTSLPSRDVTLQLYENGSPLPGSPTILITEAVNSISGQIVTLTFNASDLSDITGAGVELRISAIAA